LGGRDFQNAEHRQEVASILDVDPARIPQEPSWAYDQIIEGILSGKIRGLWVIATNPSHSWINQNMLRDVLSRLEFLVVQDMYSTTETAKQAHLLLPAAGWGEKDGTFINSERRIGTIKKVARAPGQALADFAIFRLVAEAWGCGDLLQRWTSPEAVFRIIKELSRGRPCDITGIADYRAIEESGGIQWPYPEQSPDPATQRRLFSNGRFYHADGKARFIFDQPAPLPEPPGERYPLLLLTGRGSAAMKLISKYRKALTNVGVCPADKKCFNRIERLGN
jgi:predicted molibdopterin-dependent oxidoreductase YjgC